MFELLLEALGWQMKDIERCLNSRVLRGVGLKLRWRWTSFSSHRIDGVVVSGENWRSFRHSVH